MGVRLNMRIPFLSAITLCVAIAALTFMVMMLPSASAATFTVNSTADTDDGACDTAPDCTLREAINAANAAPGTDTIGFSVGGGGAQTITPASALPQVTSTVTIDGTTQPGFSSAPLIELSGAAAGASNGLRISSSGSTVKGLVINRFGLAGMLVSGSGNTIKGNYIGLDLTGTLARSNLSGGIRISNGANNVVGGATAGSRNVISGNNLLAIEITSNGATGNQVIGNYIGTNAAGTASVPNGEGVFVNFAADNIIGGATASERNIISGNYGDGVRLSGTNSTGNVVTGNYIGTGADGSTSVPNSGHGVQVGGSASANTIGGTGAGEENRIAFNGAGGVTVQFSLLSLQNRITGNSIYSNSALGIDLQDDGVTPNDVGDGDMGPNWFQNFPVLTSADSNVLGTNVTGSLNSMPNTTYTVEFFVNTACDPSTYGEGEHIIDQRSFTTDFTGNAAINVTLASQVPGGYSLTSTATDPSGNTSEFSQCVTVTTQAPATPTPGATATPTQPAEGTPDPTSTYTPTPTPTPSPTPAPATATPTATPIATATPPATATATPTVAPATPTPTPFTTIELVAVDMDSTGNTPTSYVSIEDCGSVATGGDLVIDIAVDDIPAFNGTNGDLAGFEFKVIYDNTKVSVTNANHLMLINAGGSTIPVPLGDSTPDSDGSFLVAFADFGPNTESGAGLLSRITIRGVSAGTSAISVQDLLINDRNNNTYTVLGIQNAQIVVDGLCGATTPATEAPTSSAATASPTATASATATPTASATASGSPTPTPVSATNIDLVAIDMDTTGNTATALSTIQTCGSTTVGNTITVDVLVSAVPPFNGTNGDLAGFEFKLNYDSTKVTVTGANHAMLINAGGGTIPVPLGDSTPDSDGVFLVAFADFGPNTEAGEGVLSRITLTGAGAGTSSLTLTDLLINDRNNNTYTVQTLAAAQVIVDGSCPTTATPTSSPAATATPTPTVAAATQTPASGGPTVTPTATARGGHTATASAAPTATPTPTVAAVTQTPVASGGPTATPTATAHGGRTAIASAAVTPTPTVAAATLTPVTTATATATTGRSGPTAAP